MKTSVSACAVALLLSLWFTGPPIRLTVAAQEADQDDDGIPDSWEDSGVEVKLPSGSKRTLRGAADY